MSDISLGEIESLRGRPALLAASAYLIESDEVTLAQQVELTEIPAPPFGEEARGARVAELFVELGLEDVHADEAGNVMGSVAGDGPPLVVGAHLDTVFPPETDVRVRRQDDRLVGPGISDDGRGLAALLAIARCIKTVAIQPRASLLFVATVGEEGAGDLRGVKHLFREGGPGRDARGFISVDGAGFDRIVATGLGSRRLRATVRGAGGHSWTDWGTANPIHALGAAVGEIERTALPRQPVTTVTVARWAGGKSINAIPEEAWIEVDVRSEAARVLGSTEEIVRRALGGAIQSVNARSRPGTEKVTLEVEVIGDRPAGATPAESVLVQAAVAATRALGGEPELIPSSTDANLPMALGIPAIAFGAGGKAGKAHTLAEWYENVDGPKGIERGLLTILAMVGVAG